MLAYATQGEVGRNASVNVASDLGQAITCFHDGRLRDSLGLCERILATDPDHADALRLTGVVLGRLGHPERAIEFMKAAAESKPRDGESHYNLGVVLQDQGELDAAERAYRRALGIAPEHWQARFNLGVVLQEYGRFDAALDAYRRVLALKPDHAEAYWHMVDARTYTARDDDVMAMERLLDGGSLGDEPTMQLSFALAKVYDDLGEYDRAFAFLERANRLKRSSIQFHHSEADRGFERLMAVYSGDDITRIGADGYASDVPIFIIGMMRSGTTLIEQILASHSHVHGAGELATISRLAGSLAGRSRPGLEFPEAVTELGPEDLRRLGETYVTALQKMAPSARHVTDKRPGNFPFVGFIHAILPDAKIIHSVRNPIDTCLSCFQKLFVAHHAYAYDLTDLGHYYRAYARLMGFWHHVLPGRILDVRYEDVVEHPERETRRLLAFCELPWEDACLTFHRTKRPVRTASAAQVRRPIYRSSVGRWRRYEKHLGPLLDALGPLAGSA